MKKIGWWTIKVSWEDEDGNPTRDANGKSYEYIDEIPDWAAKNIDQFLTELEDERNCEHDNKEWIPPEDSIGVDEDVVCEDCGKSVIEEIERGDDG